MHGIHSQCLPEINSSAIRSLSIFLNSFEPRVAAHLAGNLVRVFFRVAGPEIDKTLVNNHTNRDARDLKLKLGKMAEKCLHFRWHPGIIYSREFKLKFSHRTNSLNIYVYMVSDCSCNSFAKGQMAPMSRKSIE